MISTGSAIRNGNKTADWSDDMKVAITKVSKDEHLLRVTRRDGTAESVILNSRSFLRHDFAHFAVEAELPIALGYWGLVAEGAALTGEGMRGHDIALAESLADPLQTLIRREADPSEYLKILNRLQSAMATLDLATRIHKRARSLIGHWNATPYGETMEIAWQETVSAP